MRNRCSARERPPEPALDTTLTAPRLWRLFLLPALLATLGGAATAADLAGLVQDSQGFVVVGADVQLRNSEAGASAARRTVTDSQGRFRFRNVVAGWHLVEAHAAGFEALEQTVDVTASGAEVAFTLKPAALHEGVVVTMSRQEADTEQLPLPTSLISDQRLSEQLSKNLAQSLAEAPGVTWVNAGAFRSRPVIRGLDSNRILVIVDGERLNNNRTATNQGGIETGLVDVSDIEQVEIVRGPGSVMYGSDAFGGVINILTRNALPRDSFGVGAKLGAMAIPNADGRGAHGEASIGNRWLSARVRATVDALNDYRAPDQRVFFSGADENSALGELRAYPSHTQSLWFKFFYRGGYNFGLPSLDPNPDFFAEFPFSKLQKFSGGYQKQFASSALSSIRANVYTQKQDRSFFNRIDIGRGANILSDTITGVDSTGFDVQATSLPNPQHNFTYGVSYYRDSNRDFRLQTMVGAGPNPILLDNAPSVPNSAFSGTGFFFQDEYRPHSRVRILGGVRVDRFDLNVNDTTGFDPTVLGSLAASQTDSAVGGTLGATVDVGEGFMLSGNVGRAFRAPNLFERYFFGRGSVGGFIVPNATLEPETSLQFDGGLHFRSGPVKASVNYFRNTLDSLISSAAGTFNGEPTLQGQPVFQNINISEARIQGVESTVDIRFNAAGSQWTPTFSAAWQRGDNRSTGEPLPLIAPFIGQARLRWSPNKTRFWSELGMTAASSSNRVPTGFNPIRAYTVWNWRAGYELVRGEYGLAAHMPAGLSSVNIYAGLENLGGRTYFGLFETVPQPGRDFRIGMDLSFDSSAR